MLDLLQWFGCATGIGGALALALNRWWSGMGWLLFLLSNAAWIAYGMLTGAAGLVTMQMAFTATSLLGIFRWLIEPRLRRRH